MKVVTLQPSPVVFQITEEGEELLSRTTDLRIVSEDGLVGDQEHWQGTPERLLGFQHRVDVRTVDVPVEEFWADPNVAVGKYPVLATHDGRVGTMLTAIEYVEVVETEEPS